MSHLLKMLCKSGAVAVLAAASSLASAQSGRLSLADRVAALEQQASSTQASQANADLLNRITQLQSEVQMLRGLVEEQGFKLEQSGQLQRDQAMDFDSRIARLEGHGGANAPASSGGFMDAPTQLAATAPSQGVVDSVLRDASPAAPSASIPAASGVDAAMSAPPVDPAAERAAYDAAFDALKNGQYAEAARRFQSFLSQYPDGEYAPNAQYWLGESYYVTQNYGIALDSFERLLARFPNSSKSPDALLKVGYCHYELKQWAQAEDVLNRAMRQYPDTTVARLAQGRLRALQLEHRQ